MKTSEAKRAYQRTYYAMHKDRIRAYQRAYYVANPEMVERNHAYIDSLKAAPCIDCGGRFPPECMDFDHVRGEKRRKVCGFMNSPRAILDAEIAKCELVCSNCHRIRTRVRTQKVGR